MLTALTLSEKAWEHKSLSRSIRYYNLVGKYTTYAELHAARLRAIERACTDAFFFQDTDDPYPSRFVDKVENVGFVRGPIKILNYTQTDNAFLMTYSPQVHHVVRAFLNTEKAQKVAQYLPQGNFDTFVLLYHFLDKAYGSKVDHSLEMVYRKTPLGMNRLSQPAIDNSLKWIALHEERILSYL